MKCKKWCSCSFATIVLLLASMPPGALGQADPQQQPAAPGESSQVSVEATAAVISTGSLPTSQVPQAFSNNKNKKTPKKDKNASKYDVNEIGNRKIGTGLNFYSLDSERELGRELASQIDHSARFVDDPVVTAYVNRLGQNLVRHSDAKVPFTIKVLDSDEINAFALPGGYLYVNSGVILAAENEAELAGVMAHEIAHVAARHATKNATKADIVNIASFALGMFGGAAVIAIRQVAGVAVPMTFLKFGRNAEREADLLGLEYEYAAGYDPNALVEFFERMQVQQKKMGFIARSFQSHPMKEDRVRRAQGAIERFLPERSQYIVTTSEFDQIRSRLAGLSGELRLLRRDQRPGPVLRRRSSSADSSQVDPPPQ